MNEAPAVPPDLATDSELRIMPEKLGTTDSVVVDDSQSKENEAPTDNEKAPKKLWLTLSLIRHGESQNNENPCEWFGTDDQLTKTGGQEAFTLGQAWANVPIDALYSSPLKRAHHTAIGLISSSTPPAQIILNNKLVEQAHGEYYERYCNNGALDAAYRERVGLCLFGKQDRGHRPREGGESLHDVAERAVVELMKALENHGVELKEGPGAEALSAMKETCKEGTLVEGIPHVVFVSHNSFLSELWEAMLSWNKEEHVWTRCHYGNAAW
ncbi:hypothetical protein JAAARDRAFT_212900 [Jaapia argillacea MUCL 33604]|uniref:Phosphoglycerate mutase-like protein n=1 Tax=Jaapia argillacea MUCL 33604 TaxID=933084 RepID=A0A067QAF0_9AGAM|nr:hypothetical protein JAAARDRAFT_212900 [Jaapia argillacea MUCL 33604]